MTDRMLCRIGDGTDQSQPSTVQSCFDHGYVVGKAFLDCEHLLYGVLHAGSWPGMQLTHCRLYIYIHVLRSICLCISFSEKEDNMLEYMFALCFLVSIDPINKTLITLRQEPASSFGVYRNVPCIIV
jgi:hypothetical protein